MECDRDCSGQNAELVLIFLNARMQGASFKRSGKSCVFTLALTSSWKVDGRNVCLSLMFVHKLIFSRLQTSSFE